MLLVLSLPAEVGVQVSRDESVADTHRVKNGVDVNDASMVQHAVSIEQSGEQMVACRKHVAYRHDEVASLGEHLLSVVEELLIAIEVQFVSSILSLELRQFLSRYKFPLAGVAEDNMTSLDSREEHVACLLAVLPQVLTIVNVHRCVYAAAQSLVKTVEGSVAGTLG